MNGKGTESSWFHICYYICLHGLSSWNTTVLHQTTEIYDFTVLWPAGTGRALFLTCMQSSSGGVFPWPFFWVQEGRELIPLVSLLSQGHWHECLRTVEDLEIDEQVGTSLLIAHCDSTEIKERPWKLFICSPCGDATVSYPTSHCQTPVMTAGGEGLSLMTYAVFWLLNTFQRLIYGKVFFLGWWCWENLGILA